MNGLIFWRPQRVWSSAQPVDGASRVGGAQQSAYWQALIAVVLFSLTVPVTQHALASFSPMTIAFGRAGFAGLGSAILIAVLLAKGHWRMPSTAEWRLLVPTGVMVCWVFPYTLSLGLTQDAAADMGVLLAGIPLLTSVLVSVFFAERHGLGFWLSVTAGTLALVTFKFWQGAGLQQAGLALVILLSAAVGYGLGGRLAKTLGGWPTICWLCALYMPPSLLGLGYSLGTDAQALVQQGNASFEISAVCALLYLAFFSQWMGFYFWYGAMAKASIAKVVQIQLLQPFFTLAFCAWLLGEAMQVQQWVFAVVIALCVLSALKHK